VDVLHNQVACHAVSQETKRTGTISHFDKPWQQDGDTPLKWFLSTITSSLFKILQSQSGATHDLSTGLPSVHCEHRAAVWDYINNSTGSKLVY
jgi:hypothetical protein